MTKTVLLIFLVNFRQCSQENLMNKRLYLPLNCYVVLLSSIRINLDRLSKIK